MPEEGLTVLTPRPMPLPDQTPRLPKWPFLISDAALLAAAWLIADQAAHPLSTEAVIAIVVCVTSPLVIGVIPVPRRLCPPPG